PSVSSFSDSKARNWFFRVDSISRKGYLHQQNISLVVRTFSLPALSFFFAQLPRFPRLKSRRLGMANRVVERETTVAARVWHPNKFTKSLIACVPVNFF